VFLFFFQAEDGIRDLIVTGVQTCALPISATAGVHAEHPSEPRPAPSVPRREGATPNATAPVAGATPTTAAPSMAVLEIVSQPPEIGRASCRERVEISVGAVGLKEKGG